MSTANSATMPWPHKIGRQVFRFFSSILTAIVSLGFLLLLTWLGTEAQPEKGLYAAQELYFKSWGLIHQAKLPMLGLVPIPLPGAMLLLTIFTLNLMCGGLLMLRKNKRTIGIFIAHFSMVFLLAGGLLQHRYADDGYLKLVEGESADEFVSYHDWVIQMHPMKEGQPDYTQDAIVVPPETLQAFDESGEKTIASEHLPFKLRVSGHMLNAVVMPESFRREGEAEVIDGMFLRELPAEKEAEANASAFYIDVLNDSNQSMRRGILWGLASQPLTIRHPKGDFLVKLERKRWKLPFAIQLDKFTHEFHPNTGVARVYKSEVTKIDGSDKETVVIEMNEPLRSQGHTLFQANWGPQEGRIPGEPFYSVFAVWRNPDSKLFLIPVEHWPMATVSTAALGMLIHFLLKLTRHIKPANPNAPLEA